MGGGIPYKGQNPLIPTEEGLLIPKHTLLLQDLVIAGYVAAGKCAWKKSDKAPNIPLEISCAVKSAGNGFIEFTLNSNQVDLIKVSADYFAGMKFCYATNPNTYYRVDSGGKTASGYESGSATGYSYSVTWTASTKTIKFSRSNQSWSTGPQWLVVTGKVLEQTILGFVVSNSPTAYPDGGTKDGYWYEKVVDLLSLLGCRKMVIDKFTFSARTKSDTAINHSLGEVPKFYLVTSNSHSSVDYDIYSAAGMCGWNGTYNRTYGGVEFSYSSVTRVGSGGDISSDSIIRLGGSSLYFTAGVEYTLITMA